MKNIELTKEHKSKLLEMCKVLFPEYSVWTFEETSELGAYSYDYNCLLFSNEAEHHLYKAEAIHWFEFCMTHLSDKIYETRVFNGTEPPFIGIVASNIKYGHIVDYLYEEFKKLK